MISGVFEGRYGRWHSCQLRIVLANLLSNAVKFTQILVQAEIETGWLRSQEAETVVFVRDNGVGFDITYADKLFGEFQWLQRRYFSLPQTIQ